MGLIGADVLQMLEDVGVQISTIYQGEQYTTFGTVRTQDEEQIQTEDASIPTRTTVARIRTGTLPGLVADVEIRVGDERTKHRLLYTRLEDPGILTQLYLVKV